MSTGPLPLPVAYRAIERLRSGLPPDGVAAMMAVGSEKLARPLAKLLAAENPERGMVVLGTYGAGKSHALTLMRDTARCAGFATAWLSADGADAALNHPQRFVPKLLQTLEVGNDRISYAALVTAMMEDQTRVKELSAAAREVMFTEAYLDSAIRRGVLSVEQGQGGDEGGVTDAFAARDGLVGLICGETMPALPATPNYREAAYRLLELATRLVTMSGANGLLLIIDEVESVFTKMPNRLSRIGAFRTLAAILNGLDVPSLRAALAITPDAWEWLQQALSDPDTWASCARGETLYRLKATVRRLEVHQCEELSATQLSQLLARVRELHELAYGSRCHESDWHERVRTLVRMRPPLRLAIRDAIDHLDRLRFA